MTCAKVVRLFIDKKTNQLIQGPGNRGTVTVLRFTRAQDEDIEVQFCEDGVVVELPADAEGVFGLKEKGKYDADYIVSGLAWVPSGAGTTRVYTFSPSFLTDELDALLGHNPPTTSDDKPSVDLMGQITWWTPSRSDSNQFVARVANNVNKGGEGGPSSANPDWDAPQDYINIADFFTGTPDIGDDFVDIDISDKELDAAPSRAIAFAIQKPAIDAADLMVTSTFPAADGQSVRVFLSAAPTVANYKVTILIR